MQLLPSENAGIYVPISDLINFEEEITRLKGEMAKLECEVKRCEGMLSNERFTSKAPAEKVEEERTKLEKYKQMLEKVKESLASIEGK